MDGSEVAQCYVSFSNLTKDEPLKTLQSFKKVFIKKGNTMELKLALNKRSFSYWDIQEKNWIVRPGIYTISIGSSSEQIRLKKDILL